MSPSSICMLARPALRRLVTARFSPRVGCATRASWMCVSCLGKLKARGVHTQRAWTVPGDAGEGYGEGPTASVDENGTGKDRQQRRSKRYLLLGCTAAAGTAVVYFHHEIAHAFEAVRRSGRVGVTLAICIEDYRRTLKINRDPALSQAERSANLSACHQRCADRTLRVLRANGSIFIKLGQHLSSMNYLLPPQWTTTFIPLQDQCPMSSYESIARMFERDTGHSVDDIFMEFDRLPIGAASLAQVHLARLKGDGRKVAVKVQHPALEEWVPLDLGLTRFTFATLKNWFPEYDLEWLSQEMDTSLPQELDFEREAGNAQRTAAYFETKDLPLIIPGVVSARKRILVMEYASGSRIDDLSYLDSNGISRDDVSAALAHIFNTMIFERGASLHCDPHGGNIAIRSRRSPSDDNHNDSHRWWWRWSWIWRWPLSLVRRNNGIGRDAANFEIILFDHGLYRDIPLSLKRDYAKLWLAVLGGDEAGMRTYSRAVAGVSDAEFPLFASVITGREYATLSRQGVESARTGTEQERIAARFENGLLPELVTLLSKVPRVILLILKTNDLTRSLDESLQTRHGPVRTFLILAHYATRTVFDETMDKIRADSGIDVTSAAATAATTAAAATAAAGGGPGLLFSHTDHRHIWTHSWLADVMLWLSAWLGYARVEMRLNVYEKYLAVRGCFGWTVSLP